MHGCSNAPRSEEQVEPALSMETAADKVLSSLRAKLSKQQRRIMDCFRLMDADGDGRCRRPALLVTCAHV